MDRKRVPITDVNQYWARLYTDWAFGNSASAKRWRYETRDWWLIGDLNRWYDTNQRNKDYMNNRNISWDDVKYPSLLDTTSNGTWHSLFSPSVDVLERMYGNRDYSYRPSKNKRNDYMFG